MKRIPLDVGEEFAHQPGAFVAILHLFFLQVFQNSSNERVQGYREDHDSDANKCRPAQELIKRNEGESDLIVG